MSKEQLLEKTFKANKASIALEYCRGAISKKHDLTLNLLKTTYKTGQFDPVIMAGLIGQLVALDDVIRDMEGTIKLGNQAAKELNNAP